MPRYVALDHAVIYFTRRYETCAASLSVAGAQRGPMFMFLLSSCLRARSWLSALESTKWLQHLSLLLKAALLVVNAVDRDHRPVLVHCSDGWDRTPQIVALSKLLLDPYYRTIEVQQKGLFFFQFISVTTTIRTRMLTE